MLYRGADRAHKAQSERFPDKIERIDGSSKIHNSTQSDPYTLARDDRSPYQS